MRKLLVVLSMFLLASSAFALEIKGVQVDADSAKCISCHQDMNVATKVHDQWAESAHAKNGVGCLDCHEAEQGDFDAINHYGQFVGTHPTPKDCAKCHEEEVEQNTLSKHAYPFWLYAPADRAVFEPIIGTKQGCEQCHNISAMWPDGSVGECDVCHSKHTFDLAQAHNPYTCGECHLGPDHPQIEIYLESKHGNIFTTKMAQGELNLDYNTKKTGDTPLDFPVCTTCHMDAINGLNSTHNVSERLSWESQAPWSYRTIWQEEKIGTWQEKQERMKTACKACHAPNFVEDYFLVYDLVNLQYNEIRRQFVYWTKLYEKKGLIKPLKAKTVEGKEKQFSNTVLNAGWYTEASEIMYNSWHHEGRRFRHGAAMQGADYVQWHGIWELQHNLQKMIAWGAEHGVEEAKKIYESNSPTKFFPYKIYDIPGGLYGFYTEEQYSVPALYKIIPNYWEVVKANVEQAYKKGFITKAEWERWLERYKNKDKYLGKKYGKHKVYEDYEKRKVKELNLKDKNSPLYQAIHIGLPSPAMNDIK